MTSFMKTIIGSFLLAFFLTNPASAWDFIYIEDTIESAQMVEITPLDLSGRGSISFLHEECDFCPDQLNYNLDTQLTTPFGANQDIYQLTQWQGHRAMVYHSTTSENALRIVVYSATDLEQ